MDELRGAVEDLRSIAAELRKPSPQWWQYATIIFSLLGIAGGCVAYIDFRQRQFETVTTFKIEAAVKTLKHDNQILFFLVAIATADTNERKAKIHRDMNAYKKENGLK